MTPNIAANPRATSPFLPFLACFDLTRANPAATDGCTGSAATSFLFRGHTDIKQLALYLQDTITKGNWSLSLGIRGDLYNGLATHREAEPRLGVSYNFKKTNTVFRASYARILETPFNENLVLSATGCNFSVIAALVPCVPVAFSPGWRNEFHSGLQQAFGKHLVFSGDYIWKYTHNGYDFSVLGATPITFPIAWNNSKITGFDGRVNVTNIHGFTALFVFSSVNARFFPPQIGGLGVTVGQGGTPFRIDHDEKFNETTHLQYQMGKRGPWVGFNWRFDSGLVAGAVPFATDGTTPVDLTGLTADQQMQAGLFCGNVFPTLSAPLTSCAPSQFGSTR
ncbi:MAG: TonB-dependent receptor domain-containing protein, partial [Terriglobales bacterium]